MNLSARGLEFLKQWEGFRPSPYDDGYGYLTICYGHLIRPGERFGTLSRQQCEQILANDVATYVNQVNSLVRVPVTQAMFDALVSLAYNWRDFPRSTHLQKLNAGDYTGAATRIGEHPVTSGGQYSRGLANRRAAERALFLSEGMPGGSPPAVQPDPSGDGYFDTAGDLPSEDEPDNLTDSPLFVPLVVGAVAITAIVLLSD